MTQEKNTYQFVVARQVKTTKAFLCRYRHFFKKSRVIPERTQAVRVYWAMSGAPTVYHPECYEKFRLDDPKLPTPIQPKTKKS
jgi:hypothetical protein